MSYKDKLVASLSDETPTDRELLVRALRRIGELETSNIALHHRLRKLEERQTASDGGQK